MKTKLLQVPEAGYGWVSQLWATVRLNIVQFGLRACLHAKLQKPWLYWQPTGISLLDASANDGAPSSARVVPFNQSCNFILAPVLAQGQPPSGPISTDQWTDAETNRCGAWIATNRPYQDLSDSVDEDYSGNGAISSVYNPDLFYRFHRDVGRQVLAVGGRWYGSYPGDVYCHNLMADSTGIGHIRSALLDNNTALAKMRPGQPLNWRNTPAWNAPTSDRPNLFDYKECIVQAYVIFTLADCDPFKELTGFICNIIMARNGLAALGNTRARLMSFMWLTSSQIAGEKFSVNRYRKTPNNGVVQTDRFATYSFTLALSIIIYSFTHGCNTLYCWEDNYVYSDDPMAIPLDSGTPGNLYTHYTGPDTPRFTTQVVSYNPAQDKSCYSVSNFGYDDALPVGLQMIQQLFTWGGSGFTPMPIRESGTTVFSAVTQDAILTAWQNKTAYCQAATKSAGKYAVTLIHYGTTAKHFDINFSGTVWHSSEQMPGGVMLAPGIPYCLLIDTIN